MKMLTLLGIFIFSFATFAMNGRTTYQAKIVKPDGYPLESASVNFKFTVLDAAASCVLYSENYSAVDMRSTGGLISFALGNGVRDFPASGTTAVFSNVFDNSINSMPCQTPGIYNPLPNDTRRIVMQFNDGNGWQTLPAMTINTVPYAMYANKSNDSKTLNGKADTAFVENSTLAALNCNPATHAITFNGVSFSCIPVGSGSSGITSVTTSGTVLVTGGTASAPVISIKAVTMSQDGYLTSLDYAEFKAKLAASSTQIVNTLGYAPVSGAAVATQINNSNLSGDVSGTISSNSVVSVGGKTASQISTSVNDTLAAASSATADTIVKRNSSGNATFNDIYANAAKINYVDIYRPSTSFNIRLQAPTSLSTNYVLNLPTTSGTTGQVLSTDGSGNLSWINAATGSVTSVSGTTNEITSSGGSTPTIGLANTGTAGTYYKVITDNKGRVTSGVTTLTLSDLPASVLNTTSNFAGDISGMISNITLNRIQGVSVTITSLTTNDILQYDGSKYVNKNIPTCTGSQYLTFNGTSFTCVADAGASGTITTLSVTSPLSSTGGSNPTISIAQVNSTTNGYLSSADWNTFNNKQVATSAAIIATLGYTPANDSASGTYLQKANNLSDLTNASTARSNLGLGSLAVGNSVDLGSASATGIIADARLSNQTNVTSGTQYTKVTVDGKGRVVSGAQLSSSDVTTALGYTPANATSATQWTTSGTNIFYNTGNVGIGTSSPAQKLSVAGVIESTTGGVKFPDGTIQTSAASGAAAGIPLTWSIVQVTGSAQTCNAVCTAAGKICAFGVYQDESFSTTGAEVSRYTRSCSTTLPQVGAGAHGDCMCYTGGTGTGAAGSNGQLQFNSGNTFTAATALNYVVSGSTGLLGVGTTLPTAKLHLSSGTATTAAFKMTSGSLLTTPSDGAIEYDGISLYYTDSTNTRRTLASNSGSQTNSANSTFTGTNTFTGATYVSNNAASTNSTTGALVVSGGVGIGGAINVAGNANVSGALTVSGVIQSNTDIVAGGVVKAAAGTAALPSHTFKTDAATGLWQPASGSLALSTAGSERLRVNSSGNVGIGISSPTQTLDVSGTVRISGGSPGAGKVLTSDASGNATWQTVPGDNLGNHTATQNINLGAYKLVGNGGSEGITIDASGNIRLGSVGGNTQVTMGPGSSASGSSWASIAAGFNSIASSITTFAFGSYARATNWYAFATGNNTTAAGKASAVFGQNMTVNGDYSVGFGLSSSVSYTATAANTMVIMGGNVGVDTVAPEAKLHVASGSVLLSNNYYLMGENSVGSNSKLIGRNSTDELIVGDSAYNNPTRIMTGNNYISFENAGSEKVRILSTGNVGVGTNAPLEKFNVFGSNIKPVIGAVTSHTGLYSTYDSQNNTGLEIAASGANPSLGVLALTTGNTAAGDYVGSITFATRGTASTDKRSAAIGSVLETTSTTSATGNLTFLTASDGVVTEKLRITSTGNVGVGTATPTQTLEVSGSAKVSGNLFGAVKDTAGNSLKMCTGKSASSGWVYYSLGSSLAGSCGAYIDVNTSACGFSTVFKYFTTISGLGGHWVTTGATSVYNQTATGFRIYINTVAGGFDSTNCNTTTLPHNSNAWYIDWMGVGM